MLLQPRNWAKFQHYKDRCPPWIKLHRDLLNDREFMCLPLASKALAPLLWLLASESKDGTFDASVDELVFRLRLKPLDVETGLKPLIDKGFFIVASGVLAERLQVAIPETETETERETETKREVEKKRGTRLDPLYPFPPEWAEFCKEKRPDLVPREVFDSFRDYWVAQPGQKGVKLDWDATWRNWVRNQKNQSFKPQTQLTVPSRQERDPVLVKMEEDRKKAAPISPEIRQQLQTILRRTS